MNKIINKLNRDKIWAMRIKEWHSSSLSQYAFCKSNKIGYNSFKKWLVKLENTLHGSPFIELPLNLPTPPYDSENFIEFQHHNGVTAKLPSSSSLEDISKLLRAFGDLP